jgi:hypothetical protein
MISVNTHIRYARRLVSMMDTRFSLLGLRFGIDPLLDIIPILGSNVSALASCYLFYVAYLAGVPQWVYAKMVWHIALDYLIGVIPVLGIFFDVIHKANVKNLELIEQFVDPKIVEGEIVS